MRRFFTVAVGAALLAAVAVPAARAQAVTVTIGDRVDPAHLDVPAGTTVTWRNADADRHRIRSTAAPQRLDSGNLDPGETWTFTFVSPGTYRYVDHRDEDDPAYHGTVTVGGGSVGAGRGTAPRGTASRGEGDTADVGGADASSGDVEVALVDRSFSPATVEVAAGTTVRWTNSSDRDHNVTAEGGSFASSELAPGAGFSHVFEEEGTFDYFCTLHSGMRGTVVVGAGDSSGPDTRPSVEEAPATGPDADTGDEAPAAADRPDAGADADAGTIRVEARDFAFAPDDVTLTVGDAVEWTNVGEAPHTATADDASFDSGTIDAGDAFEHRFDEAGTYTYRCTFHPDMVARLEVTTGPVPDGAAAAGDDPTEGDDSEADPGEEERATDDPEVAAAATATPPRTTGFVVAALVLIALLVPASVVAGASMVVRALRARPSR